jgi:cytochrome b561
MSTLMTETRYTRVAVFLHWLIAALMLYMLYFGEELMNRRAPNVTNATWHASIGAAILLLSLIRLWWRSGHRPPPYPLSMKPWEIIFSKSTHHVFYILMIALPLTGTLSFGKFLARAPALAGTSYFGIIPVPTTTWLGGFFGEVHEIGSKLMWALVALHVLAALKHQFIDKDGILKRMM